jgi:hypothetical protein
MTSSFSSGLNAILRLGIEARTVFVNVREVAVSEDAGVGVLCLQPA